MLAFLHEISEPQLLPHPSPLAIPHLPRGLPLLSADSRLAQVVDNVFGQDYARRMRDEVTLLAHDEAMHQNATHLVQGGKTELLVSPLRFPRALAPALARQPQPLSVSAMRNHITYVWTYELCTPLHAVLIFLNNPTLSARCNPPLPTRLNRTLLD